VQADLGSGQSALHRHRVGGGGEMRPAYPHERLLTSVQSQLRQVLVVIDLTDQLQYFVEQRLSRAVERLTGGSTVAARSFTTELNTTLPDGEKVAFEVPTWLSIEPRY
jgi:hypothetical protein